MSMGGAADHPVQIGFSKRLKRAGVGVGFLAPDSQDAIDEGRGDR
jgi:hypothetical protein